MTSPCLHRAYSCGTVSPACKVGSIACLHRTPVPVAWDVQEKLNTQRLLVGRGLDAQRLTGTRRTYDLRSSTVRSLQALARESPEERETRRRANANAVREARARECQEEGETRRRANTEAVREARARESREEGETRR